MSSHFRTRRLQQEARLTICSRCDHFKGITISQVCGRVAGHLSWLYAPTKSPSKRPGKLEEIILDLRLPAPIMIIRGGRQACQEHPILKKEKCPLPDSCYSRESRYSEVVNIKPHRRVSSQTHNAKAHTDDTCRDAPIVQFHPLPKPVYWKSLSRTVTHAARSGKVSSHHQLPLVHNDVCYCHP
jgi:hypothetical protein